MVDDARAARLVVLADDRTGALETAGACADAGCGEVLVATAVDPGAGGARGSHVTVVDIASRHVAPAVAAARARRSRTGPGVARAHKIDSTLRGNWAVELVARAADGSRVLLVPAFPRAGRTCVGGVVLEDGRPVHERGAGTDPLSPVRSSRPAEHLRRAGARDVVELAGPSALRAWFADGGGMAVADARRDDDLREAAELWAATDDVVLAGTAATVAAGAAATSDRLVAPSAPDLTAPALVVVGSLHVRARAQVESLRAGGAGATIVGPGGVDAAVALLGAGRSAVVVTEVPARPVDAAAATAVATALGRVVRDLVVRCAPPTLVVIGGDTAAAVLGDDPRLVGGTVSTGLAWSRSVDGGGPLVLTRAGGFGDDDGLSRLLAGLVLGATPGARA